MIADLLNSDTGGETTAQQVVSYFAEKGIERAAIRDAHLKPLYALLSKSAYASSGRSSGIADLKAACNPVEDAVWGVIVETREHPALEYVIGHFSEQLGISIQLFHGPANESFIRNSKISKLLEEGKVVLTKLEVETFSPVEYNELFLSRSFWRAQKGRKKILVFQTDAVLCSRSEYHLSSFLDFDYIGSKWPRRRPVGLVVDGGNGGLSLRDWHKSVECLDRFSPSLWPGGEDGYFAFHMDLIGGRIGKGDECAKFSTQGAFLRKSFGAHKVCELDSDSLEQFIRFCPEVRNIL